MGILLYIINAQLCKPSPFTQMCKIKLAYWNSRDGRGGFFKTLGFLGFSKNPCELKLVGFWVFAPRHQSWSFFTMFFHIHVSNPSVIALLYEKDMEVSTMATNLFVVTYVIYSWACHNYDVAKTQKPTWVFGFY